MTPPPLRPWSQRMPSPDTDEAACGHVSVVREPSPSETRWARVAAWCVWGGIATACVADVAVAWPWPWVVVTVTVAGSLTRWMEPGCGLTILVGMALAALVSQDRGGTGVGALVVAWACYQATRAIVRRLNRFAAKFAATGRRPMAQLKSGTAMTSVHLFPDPFAPAAPYPFAQTNADLVAYRQRARRYLAVVVVTSWAGLLDRRVVVHLFRDPGPYEDRSLDTLALGWDASCEIYIAWDGRVPTLVEHRDPSARAMPSTFDRTFTKS